MLNSRLVSKCLTAFDRKTAVPAVGSSLLTFIQGATKVVLPKRFNGEALWGKLRRVSEA
jgi:hypothetical protein